MSLPRFTAEVSLVEPSDYYYNMFSSNSPLAEQVVTPAKKQDHTCLWNYYACLAACPSLGFLAIPCVAACAAKFYSCKTG